MSRVKTLDERLDDQADLLNKQSGVIQRIALKVNVLTLENEKLTARVNKLELQLIAKKSDPFGGVFGGL